MVGPPRTVGNLGTGTAAAFVDIPDGFVVYETGIAENPKAFSSDLAATAMSLAHHGESPERELADTTAT